MKQPFLRSQSKLLRTRPLVVGTLTAREPVSKQLRAAVSARIDLLEVRLDGFSQAQGAFQRAYDFGKNLLREIKQKSKLPVLLTFRSSDEQGVKNAAAVSDARRAEILSRLLPSAELVDVEIRRREFARRMTIIARIQGVDVIHSVHDFKTAGDLPSLARLADASSKMKGDVFKVAVTPKTTGDVENFLEWGNNLKNPHRVLIAMGKTGLPSRFVGFSFGSVLTYGHLGRSAAPGQAPAAYLKKKIMEIYDGAR